MFVETIPEPEPEPKPKQEAYYADGFIATNPESFGQFRLHHRNIFGHMHKKTGSGSSGNRAIISRCTTAKPTIIKQPAPCTTPKPKQCKCPCKPTCCLLFVTVSCVLIYIKFLF